MAWYRTCSAPGLSSVVQTNVVRSSPWAFPLQIPRLVHNDYPCLASPPRGGRREGHQARTARCHRRQRLGASAWASAKVGNANVRGGSRGTCLCPASGPSRDATKASHALTPASRWRHGLILAAWQRPLPGDRNRRKPPLWRHGLAWGTLGEVARALRHATVPKVSQQLVWPRGHAGSVRRMRGPPAAVCG
jgi:hypothetical protein